VIEARPRGGSLCFRCPGGRIGIDRFLACLDLLTDASDLTLMISRRQALVVRGSFGDVPEYLYKELSVGEISGPNVKTYPYTNETHLSNYIVDRLGELSDIASGLTFSYSPDRLYRGNLNLDDFCLVKTKAGSFTLRSSLWSSEPKTVMDEVKRNNLPELIEVLERIVSEHSSLSSLRERSLREIRKECYRYHNQISFSNESVTSEKSPGKETSSSVHEEAFIDSERSGPVLERENGTSWVFVDVEAGILSESMTSRLRSVLKDSDIRSMRLTPEQNILLPVKEPTETRRIVDELGAETVNSQGQFTFTRVNTCPGSIFCTNVRTEPVQLTRRLCTFIKNSKELQDFNLEHPIGITGCGETKALERRHPIGVYPASEGGYCISMGGSLHQGTSGWELDGTFEADEFLQLLERTVDEYHRSTILTFRDWCREQFSADP
jgi:hypothetical protein